MQREEIRAEILRIKEKMGITIVAHYYQRDEVYEMADITGDSLELAKRCVADPNPWVVFCGVGFMGQSVKILAPHKRVVMPKIACCSMARMVSAEYFDDAVRYCQEHGIPKENILPITYINSNADVKAKVGAMGGYVCTSSNAPKIIAKALEEGKKILFVPDRCLGVNTANKMGLSSCVIGDGKDPKEAQIICFDGFCSVHQLFLPEDVDFYRQKYPGIKVAVHPECRPDVVAKADFVGSTSQIIAYVKALDPEEKVVVGTEWNLVHRLRPANTYVLSQTKPECPTMNETTLDDLLAVLQAIEKGEPLNEIEVDEATARDARAALERMMAL
ncbi:MAG: quinolinate synthase NadA [Campylobacterales bacterium]